MFRKFALASTLLVVSMLALSALAAPESKAALPAAFDLKPFFPPAESVSIQMLPRPDAAGSTVRVTVS